jgi:hypothetical protein
MNHPHKGGDAQVFIVQAFEALPTHKRRRDYDTQLERIGSTYGVNALASGYVRRPTKSPLLQWHLRRLRPL